MSLNPPYDYFYKGFEQFGSTQSGKAVFSENEQRYSEGFNQQDHLDAEDMHRRKAASLDEKSSTGGKLLDPKRIMQQADRAHKHRKIADWHEDQAHKKYVDKEAKEQKDLQRQAKESEKPQKMTKADFIQKLSGGLADKKKPADFDPKALKEGQKVEMEHTNDPNTAKEIAMDHLTEDKDYYKKLKTIEKSYRNMYGYIYKSGEGSRGGKITGHTSSGKPIYEGSGSGRKLNMGHHEEMSTHASTIPGYKNSSITMNHDNRSISSSQHHFSNPEAAHEFHEAADSSGFHSAKVGNSVHVSGVKDSIQKGGPGSGRKPKLMVHVHHNEKLVQRMEPHEFLQATKAPKTHFVQNAIEDYNKYHSENKTGQKASLELEKSQELEKAGMGPGSRGGKVIGHTSSGKTIYSNSHVKSNPSKLLMPQEHKEAAEAHNKEAFRLMKDTGKGSNDPKIKQHINASAYHRMAEDHLNSVLNKGGPGSGQKGHFTPRKPYPGEEMHKLSPIPQPEKTHVPSGGFAPHYTDYKVSQAHGELTPEGRYKHLTRNLKTQNKDVHGHLTFDKKTQAIVPLTQVGADHLNYAKQNPHMLGDAAKWNPAQQAKHKADRQEDSFVQK